MNPDTESPIAASANSMWPAAELLQQVYDELRRLAADRMANDQAPSRSALVHEAWLRLNGPGQGRWQNRVHFFAAAAEAMRRISSSAPVAGPGSNTELARRHLDISQVFSCRVLEEEGALV